MAKRVDPHDEAVQALVMDVVRPHFEEDEADFRDMLVTEIMAKLKPVIGAAAERRRDEGVQRDAFREGFRTGQQAGRYARWHSIIWRTSQHAKRLRESLATDMRLGFERFSKYNYD